MALLDQRFVYMARKFSDHHIWTVPCGIDPNLEAVLIGTSRTIWRYFIKADRLEAIYESIEEEVLPPWYNSLFTYTSCIIPSKHFRSRRD
ncbi:hypothetical protein CDL15_Pgr018167 [Punica granatum]|nr:hypothetical protein CDL15_Pgr018167 [Punica granatum]